MAQLPIPREGIGMDWDLVEKALGDPTFCAVMETLGHRLYLCTQRAAFPIGPGAERAGPFGVSA